MCAGEETGAHANLQTCMCKCTPRAIAGWGLPTTWTPCRIFGSTVTLHKTHWGQSAKRDKMCNVATCVQCCPVKIVDWRLECIDVACLVWFGG